MTPARPCGSLKALLCPPLVNKVQNRGSQGYERGTARNFLHSFPLSGTPVVQSYWAQNDMFFGLKGPWYWLCPECPERFPSSSKVSNLLVMNLLWCYLVSWSLQGRGADGPEILVSWLFLTTPQKHVGDFPLAIYKQFRVVIWTGILLDLWAHNMMKGQTFKELQGTFVERGTRRGISTLSTSNSCPVPLSRAPRQNCLCSFGSEDGT